MRSQVLGAGQDAVGDPRPCGPLPCPLAAHPPQQPSGRARSGNALRAERLPLWERHRNSRRADVKWKLSLVAGALQGAASAGRGRGRRGCRASVRALGPSGLQDRAGLAGHSTEARCVLSTPPSAASSRRPLMSRWAYASTRPSCGLWGQSRVRGQTKPAWSLCRALGHCLGAPCGAFSGLLGVCLRQASGPMAGPEEVSPGAGLGVGVASVWSRAVSCSQPLLLGSGCDAH